MTILEEAKDLKTAVVFMGDRGCKRTGVLGESLGGAVSVMAHNDEIDCLVLWYSALYLKSTLLKLLLAKGHRREPEEKGYVTWVREDGRKLRIWVGFIEEVKKIRYNFPSKRDKVPNNDCQRR